MTIEQSAQQWAKETTHQRCGFHCDKCDVKHCDYKSRVEAYQQGWSDALWQIEEEQAVEELKFTQGFAYREPWKGHGCGECSKYKTDQCRNHDRNLSTKANACHEFEMMINDN